MRKIESLQENEVIVVPNHKQKQKFLKVASKQGYTTEGIKQHAPDSFEVIRNGISLFWNYEYSSKSHTKLPASDFIKKSKTKQRLKELEAIVKELQEQRTTSVIRFDSESGCLTTEPPKPINAVERVDQAKDEPKLEVLPEKWCVKMDRQEVVDYCNKYGELPPYSIGNLYAHFPEFEQCTSHFKIYDGYTEISFDDFKRLVLDQPKEIDFSVAGQYLRFTGNYDLYVITTGKHNEDSFEAVGLTKSEKGQIIDSFPKKNYELVTEPFTINPQP